MWNDGAVALYPSDLSPSDGLWDLIATALDLAKPRMGERLHWVQVTGERARRPDDPPMDGELEDWPNDGAQFVTQRCETYEDAVALAHDLLAPGGYWRVAIVSNDDDAVHVRAQDAESDQVSVTMTYPIRRRRLRGPVLDPDADHLWTEEEPLRAPTWDGTTWTLRAGGRVVADLHVEYTWSPLLHGSMTPRDGFDDVQPVLERFTRLVEAHEGRLYWDAGERPADLQAALDAVRERVILCDPDGRQISDFELHGYRTRVMWMWPDAP